MSDTQLIKEKLDIVDFIGEYVQLKSSGINHKGLCPFHSEKTPSFMVNRERQSWHCFGCAKGGDIFSFVEEVEGMEFFEALKFLAARAGIELEISERAQVNSNLKNRLKEINKEAARFFNNFLMKMQAAEVAREYVTQRGLTQATIDEWQIGYSGDQWDLLTKYLLNKGYGIDDLVAAGLTIKKDGANANTGQGFYDRFRSRVMFPIRDVHGTVVGFTGRLLKESDTAGKYVNSPQTQIYDKSRVIFGLDKAKQQIREKDYIVLVEGQMDVLSTHQAGMKNVVATSGTALTVEQIQLIKRFTQNIRVAFDADDAGIAASKRGIDLALEAGLAVKVISVPQGKDPDDCVRTDPVLWFSAVDTAQNVMDWYFDRVLKSVDLSDPRKKQKAVDELLAEITRLPFAVERDHWLKQLSEKVMVDMEALREDSKRVRSARDVLANKVQKKNVPEEIQKNTRLYSLSEQIMGLILKFPHLVNDAHTKPKLGAVLSTVGFAALYEDIKARYTDLGVFPLDALREKYELPHSENLIDILLMKGELEFLSISESEARKQFQNIFSMAEDEWKKAERQRLGALVRNAEKNNNSKELSLLLEEFSQLQ